MIMKIHLGYTNRLRGMRRPWLSSVTKQSKRRFDSLYPQMHARVVRACSRQLFHRRGPTYYGTATTEATRKGRALRPHRMLSHPSDTTVVSVSLKQERSKTDSPMSINNSPMAKHDAGTADAAQLVPNMDR